jgi:hypothetical protein
VAASSARASNLVDPIVDAGDDFVVPPSPAQSPARALRPSNSPSLHSSSKIIVRKGRYSTLLSDDEPMRTSTQSSTSSKSQDKPAAQSKRHYLKGRRERGQRNGSLLKSPSATKVAQNKGVFSLSQLSILETQKYAEKIQFERWMQ